MTLALAGVEPYLKQFEAINPLDQTKERKAALARFEKRGFPTLRDEAWRYTNVSELQSKAFDKRVDVAAYNVFNDAKNDAFSSGIQVLGLAEDGVGWALDEHNEALISDDMKAQVEELSAKIKSGEIVVHDYTSDDTCKVAG